MSASTSFIICHACKVEVLTTDAVPVDYTLEDGRKVRGFECSPCAHGMDEPNRCRVKHCPNNAIAGTYYCIAHLEEDPTL